MERGQWYVYAYGILKYQHSAEPGKPVILQVKEVHTILGRQLRIPRTVQRVVINEMISDGWMHYRGPEQIVLVK